MKNIVIKIANVLQMLFGYGIMLCLFAGGLTFFGYLAALVIGGDTAAIMCNVIYKQIFPIIIKTSNILVVLGLVVMYMKGEKALMASNKKK